MPKKLSIAVLASALALASIAHASPNSGVDPVGDPTYDPTESAGLRHLFFQFGGLFLLDFDKSQKLVNQTPGGDRIVLDDFRSGFRLLQNESMALGMEGDFHYFVPAGVSVGLDVMAGKNVSFDRFVQTRDEVRKLGRPRIPVHAADLSGWKAGDNVLFQAVGGVGFAAGAGVIPVAGAGAYYFAEGDWFLYIEKIDEKNVYVKITRTRLASLGVLANSVIAGLGTDLFQQADRGFSFRYDLDDGEARLAYEDAVRGNLEPSDRLAALATASGGPVTRVAASESASLGRMRDWYFGVPFLDVVGGKKAEVYSFDNEFSQADGSHTAVSSGIYVDDSFDAGWLSDRSRRVNDFFGNYFVKTTAENQVAKGYAGQYFWAFESAKASPRTIREELGRLARKTGLSSLQSLDLPRDRELGYLDMKFSAELSQPATDALMAWAKSVPEQAAHRLLSAGLHRVQDYFAAGTDPSGLCAEHQGTGACKQGVMRATRKAGLAMAREAQAMAQARDNDPKGFARHFGEFGKQMATNQFTFREVLELTRSSPVTLSLSMEGERISLLKKVIVSESGDSVRD